jgi:hypothetical protein
MRLSSVADFHHQHVQPAQGAAKFDLPLTTGYGNYITISGKVVIPKSDELRYWRGLVHNRRGDTVVVEHAVSPIAVASPYSEIDVKLRQWLDDTIRVDLAAWIKYCFTSASDPWSWIILGAVHDFHRSCSGPQVSSCEGYSRRTPSQVLNGALKMAILASVMLNRVQIPDPAKGLIQHHIRTQQPTAIASCEVPRSVNKSFKFCVFQLLSEHVKDVLSSLDFMLRAKGNSQEGFILCVLIMLAVLVSLHQVSILSICFLSGESTAGNSRAKEEISVMEDQLFFMSKELFYRKFKVQHFGKRYEDLDEDTRLVVNGILKIPSKDRESTPLHSNPADTPNPTPLSSLKLNLHNCHRLGFAELQHCEFNDIAPEQAVLLNTPRLLAHLLAPFLLSRNE